jgi:hypothetical protein
MKSLKVGLLCLAMSILAGEALACNGNGRCDEAPGQNKPTVAVPEPGSLPMLAAGILVIAAMRRWKK